MVIVMHRVLDTDCPVVGQAVLTVYIVVDVAQRHNLFRLTRSKSSGYGLWAAAAQILRSNTQGVGDWIVAEVAGMQFDVTALSYRIYADPTILAVG